MLFGHWFSGFGIGLGFGSGRAVGASFRFRRGRRKQHAVARAVPKPPGRTAFQGGADFRLMPLKIQLAYRVRGLGFVF